MWDGRLDVSVEDFKSLLILSLPRGLADLKKLAAAGWARRAVSPLGQQHDAFFKAHDVKSPRDVANVLSAALGMDETQVRDCYQPISQHKRTPFVAVLAPFDARDSVFTLLRRLETQIGFVRLVKGLLEQPRELIEQRLKETYISAPDYCDVEGRSDGRGAERMEWAARIRDWAREHLNAFMDVIEGQERRAERLAADAAHPPVRATLAPEAKLAPLPEQPKPQALRSSPGRDGPSC